MWGWRTSSRELCYGARGARSALVDTRGDGHHEGCGLGKFERLLGNAGEGHGLPGGVGCAAVRERLCSGVVLRRAAISTHHCGWLEGGVGRLHGR